MPESKTTLENVRKEIREEIESRLSDIQEIKREQGRDYDQNCYGVGYDEGELSGLRLALAFLEE